MQLPEQIAEEELPVIISLARNRGAEYALAYFAGVLHRIADDRAREERRKIEEQAQAILAEYDAFETPTPVSAGAKYAIERLLSS